MTQSLSAWLHELQRYTHFFFNDTATTEIYTLSLHDALPILGTARLDTCRAQGPMLRLVPVARRPVHLLPGELLEDQMDRSEEHTSELQSRPHLVCRLLLEKKSNSSSVSL